MMISVVIPVYRSAESLPALYGCLTGVFADYPDGCEMLFVEDCGGDHSWELIRGLAATDPRVRGLRMGRNYGQHNALLCGIRAARGGVIVTMDDDLQHPPDELPRLLAKLNEGYDVVYGSPERERYGPLRGLASRIVRLALAGAMGMAQAGRVSAFRVFRTRLRDAFADYRNPTVNIDVLLTRATSRFAAVSVRHEPRRYGESGYTPPKLVRHALSMLIGFATRPWRMAGVIGLVFGLFGLGVLACGLVCSLLSGGGMPGVVFPVSLLAIFSGVQLLALGILGGYLARVYLRAMGRPPYVVREQTPRPDGPVRCPREEPGVAP
ncbi:MAG: glycosyltransferase [Candidatus Thiosymbion ectosymbiont of Robbea hypermnestra]|nr:glycosyltransferase [Candidatus Thiosymbion ectosymbiont of Robbea hypermnestra]